MVSVLIIKKLRFYLNNMKEKNSFVLYKDSLAILKKMTNEQAGIFIKAIATFHETGVVPEVELWLEIALTSFINQSK